MDLGNRIRRARLEAGLSQRQLCGDQITRNMLSQIEHGIVQPSVATLLFLAQQLGKPVSFLLDEYPAVSSNGEQMNAARRYFEQQNWREAISSLESYRKPDPVFDWECNLLKAQCYLKLADQAIETGKSPYAVELLEKAEEAEQQTPYMRKDLERERLLLLAEATENTAIDLPENDCELMLLARKFGCLKKWEVSAELLEAARDHDHPRWNKLRGEAYFALGEFSEAIRCFLKAESRYPECIRQLEKCYLELTDYKMAYFYACKQKNQ